MRIGIDVDDVVLDLHSEWAWRIRQTFKVDCHADDWTQYNFWDQYEELSQGDAYSVLTPDIYTAVEPFEGALEAVKAIRELGHEVVYVSSCHTIEAYVAKIKRLIECGFMESKGELVPVGPWAEHRSKATVKVDWLVDDHIGNLETFPGRKLLVTRPHNRNLIFPGKRVKHLLDVVMELKYLPQAPLLRPAQTIEVPVISIMPSALPTDKQARKDTPMGTGVLDYFSAALAEVARVSKKGNDQHNPGQPLHWARGKSTDHWDCVVRHGVERGTVDTDGERHSAKMAWRALALLQEELEAEGAPMSRASKVSNG